MQKFPRRDHLRNIETKLQDEWKLNKIYEAKADLDWETKMSFEEKNKTKYLTTFPYPYMNGKLHLGHAFSLSKCEFLTRYQRLIGKNAILPFAFHCTGMPIAAAANRIKAELSIHNGDLRPLIKEDEEQEELYKQKKIKEMKSPYQCTILKMMNIDIDLIPKFVNPVFWMEYFPPIGKDNLEALGVSCDFSRSFITTDRQVYYDKFIQWQFNKLKQAGVIKFGKRYTIFSKSDNQPCADHDRSEGEGVGVQEYTCVKLKIVGGRMPENLKKLTEERPVYLVAATLRPETMYGQTNIFVLPTGDYGVYETKDKELIICSHHSADCMSYQELLVSERSAIPIMKIKGSDIIGILVKAPFTQYESIYCIPLLTISMTKGTGIVTSVPSDAPDDYMALKDFKNDEALRKKYNVDLSWIENYQPIKIIDIPELGQLSAVDLCEERKVKDQNDKVKLAEIKDICYLKGFNTGKMLVGKYAGETVQTAKVKCKNDLLNSSEAFVYCEPEKTVKTRTKELAIVAKVDQWMISYGEEEWKDLLENHLKSPLFKSYNPNTLKEMLIKVNWLKEWGCSRTFGLGSRLPWDNQFLIESLSDSTIYMAFYTICKYFFSDMYGDVQIINPDYVNDSVFDYVFLGKNSVELEQSKIEKTVLENMRKEFTYWYPMDLRCSGKDLIPNHLTMCLYNHAFIWKSQDMLPRSIFTNGYILLNDKIMSKKNGTFMTVIDVLNDFGADATRLTLADCGDGNDDANFKTDTANSNVNRLYSFENFIKSLIKEANWEKRTFENIDTMILQNKFDLIFDNNINYLVEATKQAYESMKYKDVLKYGYYEMCNIKDQYILYNEDDYSRLNHSLMLKYFTIFFKIMNPIMPHWTEYMYKTYLTNFMSGNNEHNIVKFLSQSSFPEVSKNIDRVMFAYNKYLKNVISSIHELVSSKSVVDKKKGGKKEEKNDEVKDEKKEEEKVKGGKIFDKPSKFFILVTIYYLPQLSEDQKLVLDVLKSSEFDESNKIITDFRAELKKTMTDQKRWISASTFGAFIAKEVEVYGFEAMNTDLGFSEVELLEQNSSLIQNLTKVCSIKVVAFDENTKLKGVKSSPIPGKPIFFCE